MKNYLTDFAKGVIAGALVAMLIFGVIAGITHINKKHKEILQYAEKQIEIEEMRENLINTAIDEFLEIPDVRRAADGARDEFDRKRDEILERFRGGLAD